MKQLPRFAFPLSLVVAAGGAAASLAGLLLVKIVTLSTAIIAMILVMTVRGFRVPLVQVALFLALEILGASYVLRFFLAMHASAGA